MRNYRDSFYRWLLGPTYVDYKVPNTLQQQFRGKFVTCGFNNLQVRHRVWSAAELLDSRHFFDNRVFRRPGAAHEKFSNPT